MRVPDKFDDCLLRPQVLILRWATAHEVDSEDPEIVSCEKRRLRDPLGVLAAAPVRALHNSTSVYLGHKKCPEETVRLPRRH